MLNSITKTATTTKFGGEKDWESSRRGGEASSRIEKDREGWQRETQDWRQEVLGDKVNLTVDNDSSMKYGKYPSGLLSKDFLRGSVHQTKVSFKPTVPYSCRNKENSALGEIRTIGIKPRPTNASKSKGYSEAYPNQAECLPKQPIGNIQMEKDDSKSNDSQLQLQCLMQRSYQLKIIELEDENEKCTKRITDLLSKLKTHQEEKESMELRINTVERELTSLQLDYNDIQMQNMPMFNQQCVSVEVQQSSTQTDPTKEGEEKGIQTIEDCIDAHNSFEVCQLSCLDNEDWFSKAKYYQCALQQQKVQCANKQKECKLQLQNGQIEWKLKLDTLQRQLNNMRDKYQGKCQQVRDKESLINKYILHKQ